MLADLTAYSEVDRLRGSDDFPSFHKTVLIVL